MHNEFETKAIIEKHVKEMMSELGCQDDHDLGWIGENAESHLTSMIFHSLALSSDAQKYMEEQDLIK